MVKKNSDSIVVVPMPNMSCGMSTSGGLANKRPVGSANSTKHPAKLDPLAAPAVPQPTDKTPKPLVMPKAPKAKAPKKGK